MKYYDPHENEDIRQFWYKVIMVVYKYLRYLKVRNNGYLLTEGLRAYEWFTQANNPSRDMIYVMAGFRKESINSIKADFREEYERALVARHEAQERDKKKIDHRPENAARARACKRKGKTAA